MKFFNKMAVMICLIGGFAGNIQAATCRSIVDLAATAPALSTLVTAVQKAGLVELLSGSGSFTVLAPTNEAFARIPAETLNGLLSNRKALRQVLLGHVINDEITLDSFEKGSAGSFETNTYGPTQIFVSTANGKRLKYGIL